MRRLRRIVSGVFIGLWFAGVIFRSAFQRLTREGFLAFCKEIYRVGKWSLKVARVCLTRRGLERRFALLKLGLERVPDYPPLHRVLGNCLYLTGRFEEALVSYGRALSLGDERPATQSALLAAMQHIDVSNPRKYERALQDLENFHRTRSHCLVTTFNLGSALLLTQRFEALVEITTRILEKEPGRADCLALRGQARQQLGDYALALEDLDRCVDLDPDLSREKNLNLNRAYLRGLRGEVDKGFLALRQHYLTQPEESSNEQLAANMAARIRDELKDLNLRGTVGIFFGVFSSAVGHAILDPFHFFNLFASRFDHLVMVTPPNTSFSQATRLPLKVLEQYVERLEVVDTDLLNLSWQNLGPLSHENITFLVYNYWGLNRMAFKARFEAGHPMRDRRLYFRLPPKLVTHAEALCQRNGIDLNRPMVVLHAREHAYHGLRGQSYRNTHIQNYIPAVQRLIDDGYQVIRIGDKKMTSIQGMVRGVVELPRTDFYNPVLDPFFISRCRFMISCQSGPCSYARVFGKPNLVVNAVYHFTLIPEHNELIAFKNYLDSRAQRPLGAEEIMQAGCHLFDRTEHFQQQGIEVRDMTPEEIVAAVEEMIAWQNDPGQPETPSQEYFRDLMRQHMAHPDASHPLQTSTNDYIGYALPECRLSEAVTQMRPGYLQLRPAPARERKAVHKIAC